MTDQANQKPKSESEQDPNLRPEGWSDSGRSEDWVNNQRYGSRQGWDNDNSYGTDWEDERDTLWEGEASQPGETGSNTGPQENSPDDDRMGKEVLARLSALEQIEVANLQVFVENGEVTLTGEVKSGAEKSQVEETAAAAAGVQSVHNRLLVQQHPGKPFPTGEQHQEQRQDSS